MYNLSETIRNLNGQLASFFFDQRYRYRSINCIAYGMRLLRRNPVLKLWKSVEDIDTYMGSMWQAKPLSVASLWPFCRLFTNFLEAIHHNFTKLMIPAIKFFSASCANWNKDPDDFRTCLYLKYTEIRAVPEILCNLNTRQFTGIFRCDDIYSLIHANYVCQTRATILQARGPV